MANNKERRTLDLCGVACPMNYMKILISLEDMRPGEQLEVTLDDRKALADIPRSAKEDGHRITKVAPLGGVYNVVIEKGAPDDGGAA